MTYIINLDEYESIRTHWIALYANAKNVTYFDNFEVEHIPKEVRKFIGNKNIITNIYKIQAHDSIMCGYFCIWFIDFMLKGKSLLEDPNLFSPNDYEKNDNIKMFSTESKEGNMHCNVSNKYRKFFKKLKYHIFLKKH